MDSVGPAIAAMLAFACSPTCPAARSTPWCRSWTARRWAASPASSGAGGNLGAVLAGFLLKASSSLPDALYTLGWIVLASSLCAAAIRFTMQQKAAEKILYDEAVATRSIGMAATLQGAD